ncbi:MAG: CAP domain-containing protein [Aureispira sp.]|nr:CAP domain-containing protein [Aureispira sp.]
MKHFFLVLGILILAAQSYAQDFKGCPTGQERIASSDNTFEKEVLALVNKERKKRNRKALKWNENLAYSARYHAKDMAVDDYFEHESHDRLKNGRLKRTCGIFERIGKFLGKKMFARAENIAVGAMTPAEVVKDWMTSKGHRKNILDKEAKYLGVGYIQDSDSEWGTYWVQCFGM